MQAQAESWQLATVALTIMALLLMFGVAAWRRLAVRRQSTRRISAARVRSGHVPLEIPTLRNAVPAPDTDSPETVPEWFEQGDGVHSVVDECPKLRLRYVDVDGRRRQNTVQVKYLDLKKKLLCGYHKFPGDMRDLPLDAIVTARIADSGKRFNLDTWIDAVAVARRRRQQA